jgi:hypothetical protein
MHCKDGSKVPFLETECIFVDLDHIIADDWEIVDGSKVIDDLNITTFTFGEAVSRLKRGQKVARKGWDGKGMFLFYVSEYTLILENGYIPKMHNVNQLPWIAMKTADNSLAPWLASQTDMLANDWMVID